MSADALGFDHRSKRATSGSLAQRAFTGLSSVGHKSMVDDVGVDTGCFLPFCSLEEVPQSKRRTFRKDPVETPTQARVCPQPGKGGWQGRVGSINVMHLDFL